MSFRTWDTGQATTNLIWGRVGAAWLVDPAMSPGWLTGAGRRWVW